VQRAAPLEQAAFACGLERRAARDAQLDRPPRRAALNRNPQDLTSGDGEALE
jgi:hypothetical protein